MELFHRLKNPHAPPAHPHPHPRSSSPWVTTGIFCHIHSSASSTLWCGWDPPAGPADRPLGLRNRCAQCVHISHTTTQGSTLISFTLAQHVALQSLLKSQQGTHGHRGFLKNQLCRVSPYLIKPYHATPHLTCSLSNS